MTETMLRDRAATIIIIAVGAEIRLGFKLLTIQRIVTGTKNNKRHMINSYHCSLSESLNFVDDIFDPPFLR
jgi:hypothetical protein